MEYSNSCIKLNKYYIEGYWKNNYEAKNYPLPISNKKCHSLEIFIKKLKYVEDNKLTAFDMYEGYSSCRICGCDNGDGEYQCDNGDYGNKNIVFRWPEGLMHYYTEHNIHPSKCFYDFINTVENGSIRRSNKELTKYRKIKNKKKTIERTKARNKRLRF